MNSTKRIVRFGRMPCFAIARIAGRLQHDAAAGAVVGRALAEVPRVEVGADDDELVRLLAAADLADRVVDGDRAGDELVGDLDLDPRSAGVRRGWPAGRAGRSARGRRTGAGSGSAAVAAVAAPPPAAGRDEQAVRLAGVA